MTGLEADGSPDIGENQYTTDSLITLTVGTEYADDDDFEVRGASGDVCLTYFAFGPFKRLTFTMDLCSFDPELHAKLVGSNTLTSGAAVGFAYPAIGQGVGCGQSSYSGVAVEAWTLHTGEDGAPDTTFPYLRWLFPRSFWRIGDKNFENAPMTHSFEGLGVQNPQWLDGQGDWPVASDRAGQALPVAAVPTTQCGAQSVAVS